MKSLFFAQIHTKGLKEKEEGAHLMSDSPSLQLMPHFFLAGCSSAVRKVTLSVTCISCSKEWIAKRQASSTSFSLFAGDATYVSLPSAEEVVERILSFQICFLKCNSALRRWYHGLLFLLSQWFQVILSPFQSKHGDCIHLLFFLSAVQFETGFLMQPDFLTYDVLGRRTLTVMPSTLYKLEQTTCFL